MWEWERGGEWEPAPSEAAACESHLAGWAWCVESAHRRPVLLKRREGESGTAGVFRWFLGQCSTLRAYPTPSDKGFGPFKRGRHICHLPTPLSPCPHHISNKWCCLKLAGIVKMDYWQLSRGYFAISIKTLKMCILFESTVSELRAPPEKNTWEASKNHLKGCLQ